MEKQDKEKETAPSRAAQDKLIYTNLFHKLEIKNGRIKLDDFSIKGVTGYEIKRESFEPKSLIELSLKINIKDFEIET
ncbi:MULTISPECIES: hypothetical protein [Clostridium]|uniref:Uncharacterized protein n=1 Tax=Clostridium carnis TaxID=1530 RepID=A0ABY6SS60_9CLOT|nr:hypothetical protein [Clostridium carnis]CAI3543030.1 hypothetical protein CNEO3_1060013 [Clostridium neonatale]CAI3561508.1 hypothetical protein CNEO3_120045 [Clostridium neonatale]CAI3562809.1 hypothetical protein CNEO3_110052 [Clostridium neonatale]CAI3583753.1 hypothetical protein CNEO3_150050 [Clostridium neonatale]CAI3623506.1 hypothetical protein CNEO3_420045 [Clostridium neonatale]